MAGRRQYSEEADQAIVAGVASGMSVDEIRRTLVESGLATISRSTVGSRVAQLRGPVRNSKNRRITEAPPPAPQPPCTACGKLSKGFSPTGLCQSCANQAARLARAPEGTTWITLPNGAIRREAKCHPGRPIVAHDMCSACYAAERPPKWRSEKARRNAADAQADRRRRAAEAEGRVVKPFQPAAKHPCKADACEVLVGVGKTYCSPECRPARKARAGCSVCGAPTIGKRRTCSDACIAESAAQRIALIGSQLTSHGQPILRSESTRARRRKDRATRYKRPDKAEVIARLTTEQDGKCKACGCDGGERGLVLDHCHKSGEPRAMLCCRCNAALGLMLEQPKRIEGLLAYALAWCA